MSRPKHPPLPPKLRKALGLHCRRLRAAAGLSLTAAAQRAGITDHALRQYESGAWEVTLPHLLRMARALDVQPSQIVAALDHENADRPRADLGEQDATDGVPAPSVSQHSLRTDADDEPAAVDPADPVPREGADHAVRPPPFP